MDNGRNQVLHPVPTPAEVTGNKAKAPRRIERIVLFIAHLQVCNL